MLQQRTLSEIGSAIKELVTFVVLQGDIDTRANWQSAMQDCASAHTHTQTELKSINFVPINI